jgi:hypothetical protein
VKKSFQISNVFLVKIQNESKMAKWAHLAHHDFWIIRLFSNNIRPGIVRPVVVGEDAKARSGQDKQRLSSQVCFTPSVPKYLMLNFFILILTISFYKYNLEATLQI